MAGGTLEEGPPSSKRLGVQPGGYWTERYSSNSCGEALIPSTSMYPHLEMMSIPEKGLEAFGWYLSNATNDYPKKGAFRRQESIWGTFWEDGHLQVRRETFAVVWIPNVPKGPCAKSLVPSPWQYVEVREL